LTHLFVFVLPVLGALGAIATIVLGRVTSFHVGMFLVLWLLTGFGITVGYHRLATHRSFETHDSVRLVLLILGSMAVQGPVIEWVANHLKHHTYSDRENDPHSPTQGLWYSHWGWLWEDVTIETEKYAAPLKRDPVVLFVNRTFPIWVTLGYVAPFLIAGWDGLIWGGFFRQFVVQNVTFAVNSACHRWGKRPFETGDRSTNNWVIGILGLGEGWHNNHHAFPISAFHGLRWWEFDLSGHLIRTLQALHLAWDVRRPSMQQLQRKLTEPGALQQYSRIGA
jgi:stearoyl-CoA desaturase (delta-9 desaturase)